MAVEVSGRGQTFAVCVTPQSTDLTATQFAALLWVDVCCLQETPEFSSEANIISENCISGDRIRLLGAPEDSDFEVTYFYDSTCAGQTTLRNLGLAGSSAAYAVRKQYSDASSTTTPTTVYARVIFSGFTDSGVGIDDVQTHVVNGSVVQGPLFVGPAPV